MVSVDIVHGLSGQCPWTQWTLSMDLRSNTPAGQCPWTMSIESMDFLKTGAATRHRCDMTEKLLKGTLNLNTHTCWGHSVS